MLNPQPTIEQLADMLVAKSSLSEKNLHTMKPYLF